VSTTTRYEIRADNPNPAYAAEWAIFAIEPNCGERRVACTSVKAEAEAMLLGLQHGASMLAALDRIAFSPIGPADASDRAVLDGVTDIARVTGTAAKGVCVSS
jgi:hypothetical protein